MPPKRAYGVNWAPYHEEIVDLYLIKDKSAEETVKILQEKHKLSITLRQFKYKFGGYKHLSAKDWKDTILPAIIERKRKGRDSEVFLGEKRICPAQIQKKIDELPASYYASIFDSISHQEPSQDSRILIRTPPPPSPSQTTVPEPPPNELMLEVNENQPQGTHSPNQQILHTTHSPLLSSLANSHQLDDGFLDFEEFLHLSPSPSFQLENAMVNATHHEPMLQQGQASYSMDTQIDNFLSPSERSFCLRYQIHDVTEVVILHNLPWVCLQDVVSLAASAGYPSPNASSPRSAHSMLGRHGHGLEGTSMSEIIPILSGLVGISDSSRTNTIPVITRKIQDLLPTPYALEERLRIRTIFNKSIKPGVIIIFEIAAFMASNKKLDLRHLRNFLSWTIEQRQDSVLVQFLSLQTPTTKELAIQLVEAGANPENISFVERLAHIGTPLDNAAEKLLNISNTDFRAFVISKLTSISLSGRPGAELLDVVVRALDIANARRLITAGVNINQVIRKFNYPTTLLIEAVGAGSLEMVQLFVENHVDINQWVWTYGNKRTALSTSVETKTVSITRYLLNHGANLEGIMPDNSFLLDVKTHAPDIYEILRWLKKKTTPDDILAAAFEGNNLVQFCSQNPADERVVEAALETAFDKRMDREAINMIQHRVIDGKKALKLVMGYGLEGEVDRRKLYLNLLIRGGVDINVPGLLDRLLDDEGWGDGKSSTVIQILVDSGLDIQRHGPPAVEFALKYGSEDAAIFLLNLGTPIDAYGKSLTPLQAAALDGSLELLKDLVNRGGNINQPAFPMRGYTALQGASLRGYLEKVEYLHSIGANLDAPAALEGGATALEAAFRPFEYSLDDDTLEEVHYDFTEVSVAIYRFLLEHGASVNRKDGSPTPLIHDIIERGLISLLDEVLTAGVNPNNWWSTLSSSFCDRTPLQLAAELSNFDAIKILIKHGVSVNEAGAHLQGRTALQAAAASPEARMEIIEFLLKHGAEINAPPALNGGVTALQGAAIQGHLNIAIALIKAGADVNAPPARVNGRTAMEGAAEHGRLDMVKLLLNSRGSGEGGGLEKAIKLARGNNHHVLADYLNLA